MNRLTYFIVLVLLPSLGHAADKFQFFTIGTGGITGVYYSAGNAICKLVNQNFVENKMRCVVESTAGSAFNVKAVRKKALMFGLVEAGVHYKSYMALDGFSTEGPYKSMRSLFSLHDEVLTIMARAGSGIETIADLKGKVVDIGALGSGTRIGAKKLLDLAGFKNDDFSALSDLKPDQTTDALCKKKIDAYIYIVGHPARNIRESTANCKAKIIPVTGAAAIGLDKIPYFSKYEISAGLYQYNPEQVPTYSVRATLVADESVSEFVVYNLVKSVMDNLESFKKLHPAFSNLSIESMVEYGLTAPLHPGAEKYYKEHGVL
ncbi:MAG: TRAP transporter TAXI family solute receptor [Candidatus Endobugula sp.]|jgi:TRAP transporter TAXI family solute receptor